MSETFQIEEATIGGIHTAMAAGKLTAEKLVAAYLDRIEKLDRSGSKINSIISINPAALAEAKALDSEYASSSKFRGLLHGIPVVAKSAKIRAGRSGCRRASATSLASGLRRA